MYLIAFNITPYGSEDSNKNYYNAHVFTTHPTASANLTYRSSDSIYNDLGGEVRGVIAMDSNTNRFLVITTNNMAIYTFDTASLSLTLAQTIPGEYMEVKAAELKDGMLKIDIVRILPEEKKPKTIKVK